MPTQTEFFRQYASLLDMALSSGVRHQPRELLPGPGRNPDQAQIRAFLSRCHRGYDRGQNTIVQMLSQLEADDTLPADEREYRQLLLRKVADTIALTMMELKTYIPRRLVLHDQVPSFSIQDITRDLREANRLNQQSRLTFALLADITTFIHIADIVRIDLRGRQGPKLSLIELKTGKINEILLEQLRQYEPKMDNVPAIDSDPHIDPKYRKQAKRMLRQKARVAQVEEILSTDKGIDVGLNMPIQLSRDVVEEDYDELLGQLCDSATKGGFASGRVAGCLHLGVGHHEESEMAARQAWVACKYAITHALNDEPPEMTAVRQELDVMVPTAERFRLVNIMDGNLYTVANRPFTAWMLDRKHLLALAEKQLVACVAFDVAAFIGTARQHGIEMEFATRKDTAEVVKRLGSAHVPRWNHRALTYRLGEGKVTLLSGMLSRFVNSLTNPLCLLNEMRRENEAEKLK